MPKLQDQAELRRRRAKAARLQRVRDLIDRGYSENDAKLVVTRLDTLSVMALAHNAGKLIGAPAELLKEGEDLAIDELREASAIVRKYEPQKADVVDEAIRRFTSRRV